MMEEVVNRENMLRAYHRVVGNRGAPGVDGVTVDDLAPRLRNRWEAIREELLSGKYAPSAVRKVEIPKPGGKGVRMPGNPTALGRLIQQAWISATNGRGPWWNAAARHMNRAVTTRELRQLGLVSLVQESRRLARPH